MDLTSIYVSARYSPSSLFSINTSYDARKNVVYYETFKSYADSLLESETRQGLRTRINIRPMNYVILSLSFGYRFKNKDINESKNFSGAVSWSRIPFIEAGANISYNRLYTSYVDGSIIGLRFYKDLLLSKMNVGIGYRNVNYDYTKSSGSLKQNIISVDVSWNVFAKVYLSASYENTSDNIRNYSTLYMNFTTRF